jgi:hypothetical protein
MQIQNIITLSDVQQLSPDDFEEYRAAGHEMRHTLTSAVLNTLIVPSSWQVNGEYRAEFGGLFPVQCRFTPPSEEYCVCVCSPGEMSPDWLIVLASQTGGYIRLLTTFAAFNPGRINRILDLAAQCNALNYSLPGTAVILTTEAAL